VGPRAGLDTDTTGQILSPMPGIELRSPGRPARRLTELPDSPIEKSIRGKWLYVWTCLELRVQLQYLTDEHNAFQLQTRRVIMYVSSYSDAPVPYIF
jgi:hypothetical protein